MADTCPKDVCVTVDPGICGFPCVVKAVKMGPKMVALEISGSDCSQIKKLSERLTQISLKDIFVPISRNPVYVSAEKSGCHLSCPVPVAIIKAAEVAFGMALSKEVHIRFEACKEEKVDTK